MTQFELPDYPYMEIVWDDAASNSATWVDLENIAETERVMTRGWKVRETESSITLASSVSMQAEFHGNVGNTMTIPKGMVVTQREIKVIKKNAKHTQHRLHPEPDAEEVHREPSKG